MAHTAPLGGASAPRPFRREQSYPVVHRKARDSRKRAESLEAGIDCRILAFLATAPRPQTFGQIIFYGRGMARFRHRDVKASISRLLLNRRVIETVETHPRIHGAEATTLFTVYSLPQRGGEG